MRVLLVSQFFAPVTGGEERIVEDLGEELRRRGHHVAIATTSRPSSGPSPQESGVHRIHTLVGRIPLLHSDDQRRHSPPFPDPGAVRDLRRVIEIERPDVIHAHNWLVHSAVAAAARRPLVLTLHDYGLVCANKRLTRFNEACSGPGPVRCLRCSAEHYGPLKGVATALSLRARSSAVRDAISMFLPVSRAVAHRSGLAAAGLPYEIIPNFVSDDLIAGRDSGGAAPLGLPHGDFLVFAGDVTYDKGIGPLLGAYALLQNAPPLVLAGRILTNRDDLERPGIIVMGPRSHGELMEIFRRSLGVIVPSLWSEPFGLVALEAMAVVRPVVASSVGGLVDIGEDGVTGLLTPPGDEAALAAAMSRLIRSPELRAEFGRAGAIRSADFSGRVIVPRIEAVYRRLCSGRGSTVDSLSSAVS